MPQVLRTLRINGGRMERLRGARYATGSTNVENQWWQNGKVKRSTVCHRFYER